MKKSFIHLSFALTVFGFTACHSQKAATKVSKQKPVEARIDSIMKLMTLEEKIGQMNQYNGFWEVTGPAPKGGNA